MVGSTASSVIPELQASVSFGRIPMDSDESDGSGSETGGCSRKFFVPHLVTALRGVYVVQVSCGEGFTALLSSSGQVCVMSTAGWPPST